MARGDAAEVEAILKTIKETAPDLLTKELEAAARAVIERQLAQQAAQSAAQQIARREIQEAFAAQFARVTPKNADAIRGQIMRAFFKHGFEPGKIPSSRPCGAINK